PEDAQRFNTLAGQVKTAFHRRFYHADTGYYDNGTQTSCVLPLAFDMVPAECRASVFAQLVKSITVENDNHLRTGLIGGHYLLRVLSDNGRPDLAYTLATQTTYPSWGYMARQGATTMWELWNGDTADAWMNSCNIVMLIGDLNIWLHEYLGGIRCAPGGPGFKHILIQPEPVGDLTWCRDRFDSPYGPIQTEWHHSADTFDLQVVVPVNTTAEIRLPAAPDATIWESGRPVAQALGLTRVRQTDNQACYQVGSGTYHFWVSP
ncbi:MAG TPA: alpha-L-rhamnosidase C-terminal domain-containing protein, partial [Verrucomicrobiae bacterium]